MAITYQSQGAGAGTESTGAALNLVCPAAVAANDILIAHVIYLDIVTTPSTPADWTLLYGPANLGTGTAVGRAWVFGKLAVGTEDGATIGFGTAGGTAGRFGRIYSFSGYVSGTLADVVPAASFTDIPKEDDPGLPTVATTVAGALAIALIAQDDNNALAAGGAQTGGTWAEPVADFVSTTLGAQGCVCQIQTCTPTADPGTVTGGVLTTAADESSTIGFEIRPNLPSNQYVIAGAVTVTMALAAVLDLTRHAALLGAVTIGANPAATMDYTRHAGLVGAVAISASPSATMQYTAGGAQYALVGAVTTMVLPTAALDFQRHAGLVGGVTLTSTLAAVMDLTRHPAFGGAVIVQMVPSATLVYQRHASLTGQITVSATPAAVLDYSPSSTASAIVGAVTVTTIPAATVQYQQHRALTGTILVQSIPWGTLEYSGEVAIALAAAARLARLVPFLRRR